MSVSVVTALSKVKGDAADKNAKEAQNVLTLLLWVYVILLSTYAAVISTINMVTLDDCACGDGEPSVAEVQGNDFPIANISTWPPSADLTPNLTFAPSSVPTQEPTLEPSVEPTLEPTLELALEPSVEPSLEPTQSPTAEPTYVSVPVNAIVIWSDCANIPDGWTLCDGGNGTPDLQGRFVVGGTSSNSTFNYGEMGGASTHSHVISTEVSGSVGGTSLTIAQMPAHNHGNGDYKFMLRKTNMHTHTESDVSVNEPDLSGAAEILSQGSGQAHSHTLTLSHSATAASTSQLPPYYALCYIMKFEF